MRNLISVFLLTLAHLGPANVYAAENADSSGTGFLINRAGWVITNAHVVDGCTEVTVGEFGKILEIRRDPANDLAAVRISGNILPSPLAIRETAGKLGEDVVAFGYPLSGILSDGVKVTTGNVNSLVGMDNDTRYLQISAPIQPGNSGGPLVDKRGLVLGINSAQLGAKFADKSGVLPQNVNFAVKTISIELFLQSNSIAYDKKGENEPKYETDALSLIASPAVFQILCFNSAEKITAAPIPDETPKAKPFAEPNRFAHLTGADVIGFDYATMKDVSGNQCRAACEQDHACIATTYNKKNRYCFLKNNAAVIVKNSDSDASYRRVKESEIFRAPLTVYSARDVHGGDFREIHGSGFVGCVVECLREKNVSHFHLFVRTIHAG